MKKMHSECSETRYIYIITDHRKAIAEQYRMRTNRTTNKDLFGLNSVRIKQALTALLQNTHSFIFPSDPNTPT